MGIIPTLNTFVAGTPIVASAMNSNFEAIVTVVNGGLDDSNILQISADKVTSGEFDPDRIPRLSEDKLPRAGQGFLKATGTSTDPTYALVQWGDVQSKPAEATRWPAWSEVTDKPATATRWPTWGEVTSKPSTFPPSAHSHARGDLPVGATNSTQVAPGQGMSGSGDARHPVGAVRLVHAAVTPGGTVTAGTLMSGVRLATLSATKVNLSAYPSQEDITADVISIGSYSSSPTLPGSWTILSQVDSPIVGGSGGGAPGLALAVRVS